ncbi:endonuclease/exonuclease/phosphatase family protein [Sphingomonas sp.]|uniref:endonuclease/exonuclease/phosphatase family protein n=1 Tax=Sphingomonas sp. TaxID=28214 RepID=UPI002B52B9BC|nr:endonuclease/exonuclease/phosphatase family protein [Sphingomonas sp.]HTG38559.1 endonuclease/exonuclease/phosphatase family protein [Sphingomonas sp.]
MMRLFALLALLIAAPLQARDTPLTVMSFNVRYANEDDGPDRWSQRRDRLIAVWRRVGADIVGTQELLQSQGDAIVAADPRYRWFGRDRRGGHADEHMSIFYRHDRLKLLDSGDFWLSDTPDVPGSISWEHPYPRMVTWGRFEQRASGRQFTLINTHFPYRPEDEAAREKAAEAIAAFADTLPAGHPLIVTGDFNTTPESAAYQRLTRNLRDLWIAADKPQGVAATYHAFTGKADRRIDWVLARGFVPLAVCTDSQRVDRRYPSDHFPVVARLAFSVTRP